MKKLILLIGCILIANLSLAQKYYPQPELQKFAGTWEFSENNQTFKIMLKIGKLSVGGIKLDVIEGEYIYLINNKIVQNSMDSNQSTVKPAITNGRIENKEKTLTKIKFLFHDKNKDKLGYGYLELLPGKTDEAIWTLRNKEVIRVGSADSRYDFSFSVPEKLRLHKIK